MARRRKEALELRVRDHHRGVVHERMRMNGVDIPQAPIDNVFDRLGRIVDEREKAD